MAEILSREDFAILKVQATVGGPVHTTELAFATIPTIEALAEALTFATDVKYRADEETEVVHARIDELCGDLREKGWIE